MTNVENYSAEGELKLPIGLQYGGKSYKSLPLAVTGSDAEKIFTSRPKQGKHITWIAQVISTSLENIGGEEIASEFNQDKEKKIPSAVLNIPFLDAGGLLIQIQRECWEEVISNQRLTCPDCGTKLTADIELEKIQIPDNGKTEAETHYNVDLKNPISVVADSEILADFKGMQYNRIVFRTATLRDAINFEGVAKDEVVFWKELAFHTIERLEYVEDGKVIDIIPRDYISRRGKLLFNRDLNTKQLKAIRQGMMSTQESVKTYYNDNCYECGSEIPFFAQVNSFFQT